MNAIGEHAAFLDARTMQKLSMLASVVSGLVLSATALAAMAQGSTVEPAQGSADGARGAHRQHEGGGRRGAAWQSVKGSLTAEQQQQMDSIKAATKEQSAPVKAKLEALRAQIEAAQPGTNVD